MTDLPSRDVISIGEGQLRLDTAVGSYLETTSQLSVHVAGTEGNVLGLLARLGNQTGLITALPMSPLGRRVHTEYKTAGIDTRAVVWRKDGRLALYFVEQSRPPVPTTVLYDRTNSCFATMTAEEVDWRYLADGRMLHLSGITAALGDRTYGIVLRAAQQAREAGQLLSVDVNYRAHLWAQDTARTRMSPLVEQADVLFCSRRDAAALWELTGEPERIADQLADATGAKTVLVSNGSGPLAAISQGVRMTAQPPATDVVDRVGAGDALIGGFLHGILHADPELGLRLGVAAAALALSRHGDQVRTTLAELDRLSTSLSQDIVR